MNKAGLVARVMERSGDIPSEAAAKRIVDDVLSAMFDGITDDGNLMLVGFGTFTVSQRAAREGRNPQSGEAIQIAAKKTVKFKPSGALREVLN